MTRTISTIALSLACSAGLASAQSASVTLTAPSSAVAPGGTIAVTLNCSYDLAGAGTGVFGAAGFYGFGGDVTASGNATGDASAAAPLILAPLDSGDTVTLAAGGNLLRAGAGRGLSGGLATNPIAPLTFDVVIDPAATPGTTLTLDFDGAVVLVRDDALEAFSTSPGVGQSSLTTMPLVLTIGTAGCSPADVTTDGSSNGIPDGEVTLSDFSFYLGLWGASDSAADLTTDGTSNGIPDGAVTLSDFSFYLGLWGAGCP